MTYIFTDAEGKTLREVVTAWLWEREIEAQKMNLAELHHIRPESIRMEMK